MNIYSNPEKFGLTQIGVIERPDMTYEFKMLVVWRNQDGRLCWADDAGCSCPIPFEDKGIPDLSTGSQAECFAAIDRWLADSSAFDWARVEMHSDAIRLKETIRKDSA